MPTFGQLTKSMLDVALNSADSTNLFTSTRRAFYINEAIEEFADLTECFIRQSSITLSCNTTEYMLLSSGTLAGSTDFVRLAAQGVEYRHLSSGGGSTAQLTVLAGPDDFPDRSIHWRNAFDAGWRQSTTPVMLPSGYYLRPNGGNLFIGLAEPPSIASSAAAELRVPYVARPTPMTDTTAEPYTVNSTTRIDLRPYHKAFPHYAAAQLLPLIGDWDGANAQTQLFMSYVQRYKAASRPKGGQHLVPARSYLSESRSRFGADDWRRVPGWTWRSGG